MKKIILILIVLAAFLNVNAQTTYYVDNIGTGDTLSTIAEVNALSLTPSDSVLFKRGGEWRGESLIVQWSGTEANPIVIGAYGTGDKPIFNGSEIITDWTNRGSATQQIDWSKTLDVDYNNTLYQNFRTRISASDLSTTGDSIRIKIKAHGTNDMEFSGASVGESASGDDFDSTPTRITFDGGSNTTTVTAGIDKYSDWVLYNADPINDIILHSYLNSNTTDYVYAATGGVSYRSTSSTDNTMTTTVDYGTTTAAVRIVSEYEVKTTASNIWVTPSPQEDDNESYRTSVVIDDDIFLPVDALSSLLADLEYYALNNTGTATDSIFVYSETDPALRTAELSVKNNGISCSLTDTPGNTYQYITIEDLDIRQYGYTGIQARGIEGDTVDSYMLINNCDFLLNRNTATSFRFSSNNTVQNCTADYCGNGMYSSRGARNNSIIGNTITNTIKYSAAAGFTDGHAIGVYTSTNTLVESNYIIAELNGGGGVGIDLADGIFRYNEIYCKKYGGIWPNDTGDGDTLLVHHNLLVGEEGGHGFLNYEMIGTGQINVFNNTIVNESSVSTYMMKGFINSEHITFQNNIFYNTGSITYLLEFTDASTSILDYNLWYNDGATYYVGSNTGGSTVTYTTLSAWQSASSQDANSIEGNPLFTDISSNDFTIQSDSPAKNTGTDLGFTRDILGNPIVGLPDIGAYEYTPVGTFKFMRNVATGKYVTKNGEFVGRTEY